MNDNARRWRVVIGGVAAGMAGVLGFAGVSASAEPVLPIPPAPAPATVTQTVTVAPAAAGTATAAPQPTAAPGAVASSTVAQSSSAPSIATTSAVPAAPTPTLVPASSGTLTDFFKDKGVTMEPQKFDGFTALNIVMPVPAGWSRVPDPNVPDAFAVIADRVGGDGLYTSNAQLVVYKLVGEFDPKEAITHGYVDSQQLFAWQSTDASLADFGGFPSAIIEGTYRANDMTLNASRRHVIAQSGPDRYLVSLTVTTAVNQAVAAAPATDAIVNGFRVTSPDSPAPAPAQAAAPAATPAPAAVAAAAAAVPGLVPGPAR
jgi:Probable lipoprotein LpqN